MFCSSIRTILLLDWKKLILDLSLPILYMLIRGFDIITVHSICRLCLKRILRKLEFIFSMICSKRRLYIMLQLRGNWAKSHLWEINKLSSNIFWPIIPQSISIFWPFKYLHIWAFTTIKNFRKLIFTLFMKMRHGL